MNEYDVIVVGGGVAGLQAALMLGRACRRVLVVDSGSPRNRYSEHMHGVLGNEGVDPAELLARGREEVGRYGVEIRRGAVDRVDLTDAGVRVSLPNGEAVAARALVVASGMTDELPEVPGLAARWGRSVLHCPYCHGWEVRGQRLGVLATSATDGHRAQLIRQWSDHVVFFAAATHPVEEDEEARLRARGVEFVTSAVAEVLGEGDEISGVRTDDGRVVEIDALFTGGESLPHDTFLRHLDLARTNGPMGSLLEVDEVGATSSGRIWAVGNVVNPAATVPMAMGAGALTGGAVNMALIQEDFDRAQGDGAGIGTLTR
ncbi:NAD(P)/FAD-dependent oxidoreductase [Tessaracoccus sp. MC1865]|uniref:NAD(P)/FAD-dependent oxidoreductase n=1 Tax=Tessaracoccus sp. MC1865 TaxID=2760310 RepID=UPI001603597E|nr:NAD(P)/FAD-dependent oxidoreductase [Tessaracoccus sp. MC1865]MBB1483931.1 NAD(P)/FAD-dependent oxidoreductase [Tessaracoccus sp. MC1865]QTO36980.1 NAD(P)/FAD-dependent oxidoreductase [Tessaracoccus sp. MC1865]